MWHVCRNVVFQCAGARNGAVRSCAFEIPMYTRMQPTLEIGLFSLTCFVHLYRSVCMLMGDKQWISGIDGAHWLCWQPG